MNGFFARLGARATGAEPGLRVRTPQRFESATAAWAPAPGRAAESLLGEIAEVIVAQQPHPPGPPQGRPEARSAAAPPPAARASRGEAPGQPALTPLDPLRTARARRAEYPPAAGGETAENPRADHLPARTAARHDQHAQPQPNQPRGDLGTPPPPEHPTPLVGPGVPQPARPVELGHGIELLEHPLGQDGFPPPAPGPLITVGDVAELVRRHVLPALADRGLTRDGEPFEIVTDAPATETSHRDAGTRRPGSRATDRGGARIEVTSARITESAARQPDPGRTARLPLPPPTRSAAPAPQVHVHIDRVVVARPSGRAERAVPPPSTAAPPPTRTTRDHSAYLARRREDR